MREIPFLQSTNGFTMIELLLVLAILVIMLVIIMPNVLNARKRANETAAQQYAGQVATYIAAADTNPAVDKTALKAITTCNDALLTAEGAAATLPASVKTCTVAYAAADERYTVTTTTDGAKTFSKIY